MKSLFLILIFTVLAQAAEKPTLVEFYAKWCIPCLQMEKTVFKDPAVKKYLSQNFNFVRLDTDKNEEIFCEGETLPVLACMELWDVGGLPAFAILDKEGSLRHITVGEFDKEGFMVFLRAIKK
ncbi:MAG: thioredoxin family protein [Fibromonadales bacterium]|nr:thioredoxin family protein [Fibromonadales bacterium]